MISDRLEQADVRVDKVIWIPGAVSVMGKHEDLYDLICDDLYESKDAPEIVSKIPAIERLLGKDRPEWDEILEALYGVDGFFVQLSRPIPTAFFSDTGYSSSWGYCQLKWAYVETIEEVADIADVFSTEVIARSKSKLNEVAA